MRNRAKAKAALYSELIGFRFAATSLVPAAPGQDEVHPLAVDGYATASGNRRMDVGAGATGDDARRD